MLGLNDGRSALSPHQREYKMFENGFVECSHFPLIAGMPLSAGDPPLAAADPDIPLPVDPVPPPTSPEAPQPTDPASVPDLPEDPQPEPSPVPTFPDEVSHLGSRLPH